jgi:hypothetical protein
MVLLPPKTIDRKNAGWEKQKKQIPSKNERKSNCEKLRMGRKGK